MPDRIDPCLALLKPKPPKGSQWAFEVKWDAYRLAVSSRLAAAAVKGCRARRS